MAKRIQLKKTATTFGAIQGLSKQIIHNLGNDVFEYRTMQVLLFNVLKQISPVYKKLKLTDESIEGACLKVVAHFYHEDLRSKKIKHRDNTKIFCQEILGTDKVPALIYEDLLRKVTKDLKSISELIKWYEKQPCILKYIETNETPKNHEETIVYDFYKRCIAERIEILNYQLDGIKERALSKARYMHGLSNSINIFTSAYYDRPYHYARPYSIHYFDSRKIDLVGHRIDDFYSDELDGLIRLYRSDKAVFYKKYFQKKSIEKHFSEYKSYLSQLPLRNNRQIIFDQLHKLYRQKLWIGFYALALPQVEGIFSEMCLATLPNKNFNRASLTKKVNSVRPYHYLSQSYFDYYEYHIPLQRNRFLHTGYDDNDFKLMSYDLLADLLHVLKIFYELDHPHVKIKKMHIGQKPEEFITISDFSRYFLLLKELDQSQMKSIKPDIDRFESTFLSKGNITSACYQMMNRLPERLSDIIQTINESLKIEVETMILPSVKTMLQDEKKKDWMENCFFRKSNEFDELLSYYVFLGSYKTCLPSLDTDLKNALDTFHKSHKKNLTLICEIGKPFLNFSGS